MPDYDKTIKPEVGVRYHVKIEDCCVTGEFVAAVVKIDTESGDEYPDLYFDNGVRLDGWGFTLTPQPQK